MSSSLALFALFSIGSAAASVPCTLDSVAGDPCTTGGDFIGTCDGSQVCIASAFSSSCDADDKPCGTAALKGKCSATNCKYSMGPCATNTDTGGCVDATGLVGTCSTGTCTTKSCIRAGTDCTVGSFKGTCDADDDCQHNPLKKMCLKKDAACADSDGLIGQCNNSLQCTVPNIHSTCSVEGTACEQGRLQGKCTAANKCNYIAPEVACVTKKSSCTDSYGFFGQCLGGPGMVKCTPTRTCVKGEACKDIANKLEGMCTNYSKCRYLRPAVACGATGVACTDSYGFIGLCDDEKKCIPRTTACSKGSPCRDLNATPSLDGICVDGPKCRYLPVAECSGTDPCVDRDGLIGACSSTKCVKQEDACDTGDSCKDKSGSTKYWGICVDANRCKYTPPVAPCGAISELDDACTTSENAIGQCKGSNPRTCTVVSCTGNNPCEQGKLKGKCNSAGSKCLHDPLVAPCAATWGTGDGCTDSGNLLGKCGEWGTRGSMTCAPSQCGLDDNETCKEGSLNGICVEGNNCKYAPPRVPCTLTSAHDAECTDATGLIGKCAGTPGSRWCSPATISPRCSPDDTCKLTTLTGICVAGSKCKFTESFQVEYTVQPPKYKNPVVADVLTNALFNTQLGKQMDRTASGQNTTCGDMPTDPNGQFTEGCNEHEPNVACVLECTSSTTHKVKGTSNLVCDKDTIQWKGTAGKCEKYCLQNASGFIGLTKLVTGGTLTCASYFEGDPCTLKCDPNYRVQTAPTLVCGDTRSWAGNDGVCGHAVDISASVHVLLKDGDDHDLISTLGDDSFNKDFKNSVSTLTGVLPENVLITKITLITSANGRRLTQRSVQVDYSVQVGATDGTHSPEGVGGGLRGIP